MKKCNCGVDHIVGKKYHDDNCPVEVAHGEQIRKWEEEDRQYKERRKKTSTGTIADHYPAGHKEY